MKETLFTILLFIQYLLTIILCWLSVLTLGLTITSTESQIIVTFILLVICVYSIKRKW